MGLFYFVQEIQFLAKTFPDRHDSNSLKMMLSALVVLLAVSASQVSASCMANEVDLVPIFDFLDDDGDSSINQEELNTLTVTGDADANGQVTAAEFQAAWQSIAVGFGVAAEKHAKYFKLVDGVDGSACGWGKSGDLLLHSVSNTGVHGGASGHDGVGIEVLSDINVALHDGVVGGLVDSASLHSEEGWLEECLWASESLVSNGDDLTVGKLIGLLKGGGGSSGGHLLLEVKGNIAELLLDVTDNLALSGGGERVASLGEDLHQVVGELTSSKVKTDNGVWESITLVDWDTVGDTVTGVHDDTGGTSRGVEGEDSLDGNIHGGHIEGLKHNLGHLLTVSLGVEGSLSKEDGLLLGGNTEFIV